MIKAHAYIPDELSKWNIEWLNKIIMKLNEENLQKAQEIEQMVALQPGSEVIPITDLMRTFLNVRQYPLVEEVYKQRAQAKELLRLAALKNLQKTEQDALQLAMTKKQFEL